jgi:hypothetical protein
MQGAPGKDNGAEERYRERYHEGTYRGRGTENRETYKYHYETLVIGES